MIVDRNEGFAHLHCHTSIGSMTDSMAKVDELFKRANQLGQKALAITDHGTMAAVFDARKASVKYGVKYIPGIEAYFVDNVYSEEKQQRRHIVLLAKSEIGYKNILRLNWSGFRHLQYVPILGKVFARIDWEMLKKHSEGIICLTACGSGLVSRKLFEYIDNEWVQEWCRDNAINTVDRLKSIFGDDLYLEMQPHSLNVSKRDRKTGEYILDKHGNQITVVDQRYINETMRLIGDQVGVETVATCDVHYLDKEDAKVHDMLMAINEKAPLSDKNRHRYNVEEFYMKTRDEVYKYFEELFDDKYANKLCDTSVEIANKCSEPSYLDVEEIRFPEFNAKEEKDYNQFIQWKEKNCKDVKEDFSYLRFKCISAFKKKFGNLPKHEKDLYKKRIIKEINVLESKNFSSYMLITHDFLAKAREQGFRVGPGRGCLCGDSLVMTSNGFKKLKDININDNVFTHLGNLKKVKDKMVYSVSKETLIEISTQNSLGKICMTADHKLYGITKNRLGDLTFSQAKRCGLLDKPQWAEANQFSCGSLLFTPFVDRIIEKEDQTIDLLKFVGKQAVDVDENFIFCKKYKDNDISINKVAKRAHVSKKILKKIKDGVSVNKKAVDKVSLYLKEFGYDIERWKKTENYNIEKIKRYLRIDEDFSYFIGRWIGDGTIGGGRKVYIVFNKEDLTGIKKIKNIISRWGFKYCVQDYKYTGVTDIVIHNKILVNIVKHFIDSYNCSPISKHLPAMFRRWDKSKIRSLLLGLKDSDGCTYKNREQITTTSIRLSQEIKESLLYLKIPSSISVVKTNNPNHNIRFDIRFSGLEIKNVSKFITDKGYYSKVIGVDTKKEDFVYDISVEGDKSYLTSNYAVHNSVGGSLVAHLLGIHDVNPIEYGLIFERFLNVEKVSFPDIDSDFSPDGLKWVKNYISNRYGKKRVAHVSNLSTMTPKVVIKDIARSMMLGGTKASAFKIANEITDDISDDAKTFDEALNSSKKLRECCAEYPFIKECGLKLVGLEKVYSTHAAGLIVSDIDLIDYIPLRVDKNKAVSVQYEKNRCEKSGLIKMDLLGLEHLRRIDSTIKNAKKLGMDCPEPNEINLDDKNVWDMISSGKTLCVFQMGSAHMSKICKQIKPNNIMELAAVNALGRPSAVESRDTYIKRKHGHEKINYKLKCLEKPFKDTFGICLYEEQLAKLASHVAGWDLKKADGLRKLTKYKGKDPKLVEELRNSFIKDSKNVSGLTEKEANFIWTDIIDPFGKYGFNLSHAVFYSLNGYYTAYYKYHYPAPFMAAVLQSEVEKASSPTRESNIRAYKKEAAKLGISIRAPDINFSGPSFTVLDERTIVTGLAAIKGVGEKAVNNIIEERNVHRFKSFADFLLRTSSSLIRKNVIQPLAKAGCFDSLDITRKNAHDNYSIIRTEANKHYKKVAEEGRDAWDVLNDLEESSKFNPNDEWPKKEILQGEQETLGEYISGTVNDAFDGFFTGNGVTSLSTIKSISVGHNIRTESIIMDIKQKKTKKGNIFAECSIQDVKGNSTKLTIWPEMWKKYKKKMAIGSPIRVVGKINAYHGQVSLTLERIESIGA